MSAAPSQTILARLRASLPLGASQLKSFFKLEPFKASVLLISIFLTAAFEAISISIVIPILHAVLGSEASTSFLPLWFRVWSPATQLRSVALVFFLAILAKATVSYCLVRIGSWLSWSYFKRWADGIMLSALRSDLLTHLNQRSGEYLTLINESASAAKGSVILIKAISHLAIGVFLLMAAAAISWRWLLICVLVSLPIFLMLQKLSRKMSMRFGREKTLATTDMNSEASENLLSLRLLKAYDLIPARMKRFGRATQRLLDSTVQYDSQRGILDPLTEVLMATFICGGLIWISFQGREALVGAVPVIAFFIVAFRRAITYCSTALQEFSNATYFQHSTALIRKYVGWDGKPIERVSSYPKVGAPFFTLQGDIRLDKVQFVYEPGRPGLSEVSMAIPRGRLTVLVGPSGAGKSTICDLLLGFIQPTAGAVLLGDQDLRSIGSEQWRRRVAYVSQETILLNGTIEENLRIARPEAMFDEICQAALRARIHDFIVSLPQGYKTPLGERGLKISGGQRQRLSLARALLRDPEFFLFDEPTSALDRETEKQIEAEILELIKGRTTLIVTHGEVFRSRADNLVDLEPQGI